MRRKGEECNYQENGRAVFCLRCAGSKSDGAEGGGFELGLFTSVSDVIPGFTGALAANLRRSIIHCNIVFLAVFFFFVATFGEGSTSINSKIVHAV